MSMPPSNSSVILSPAKPLHNKGTDSRFPFATTYAGITVILFGLLILPAFALGAIRDAWVSRIIQFVLYIPVLFFVFRWAIRKHVLPYVTLTINALTDYGSRFSFKNPFLAGVIAYFVLNLLISSVFDPIIEPLKQELGSVGFAVGLLTDIVIGYFAFTLAVKRVVLRPYRVKRLLPMLGLIFVLSISITFAISLGKSRQEWAFRNHVYCEVLRPGMTQAEVTIELNDYEMLGQVSTSYGFDMPGMGKIESFTIPYFKDSELRYRLNLVLGYDADNTLVAVGREDMVDYTITATAIECPLPFR